MYWSENPDEASRYEVPDDIVDLSFKVSCRCLPLDHAFALSTALHKALAWLEDEPTAGIHLIHGAESGNGWIRPQDPDQILYLSRRTRMTLRLPKARLEQAKELTGETLNLDGNELTLRDASVRKLSSITTVFARYVITDEAENEVAFLENAAHMLGEMGIQVKKMMSGRSHCIRLPDRLISTRSLMMDGLEVQGSVRLQQEGLGPGRKIGCGLFLPHKGIGAVAKPHDSY